MRSKTMRCTVLSSASVPLWPQVIKKLMTVLCCGSAEGSARFRQNLDLMRFDSAFTSPADVESTEGTSPISRPSQGEFLRAFGFGLEYHRDASDPLWLVKDQPNRLDTWLAARQPPLS
jgi:hypothetical protein